MAIVLEYGSWLYFLLRLSDSPQLNTMFIMPFMFDALTYSHFLLHTFPFTRFVAKVVVGG